MQKKRIAITGGIGSGKSAVLKIFSELGYGTYSCDDISRSFWQEEEYQKGLLSLFPSIEKQGRADKKLLSELVFSNEEALKKLNAFSHPKIMLRLNELMDKDVSELVFAEVPLLFEGGYEKEFDHVIVVLRDKSARLRSTAARDGASLQEVEKRINAQFDYGQLIDTPAYFRLPNDGTFKDLEVNTFGILRKIMKQ